MGVETNIIIKIIIYINNIILCYSFGSNYLFVLGSAGGDTDFLWQPKIRSGGLILKKNQSAAV